MGLSFSSFVVTSISSGIGATLAWERTYRTPASDDDYTPLVGFILVPLYCIIVSIFYTMNTNPPSSFYSFSKEDDNNAAAFWIAQTIIALLSFALHKFVTQMLKESSNKKR